MAATLEQKQQHRKRKQQKEKKAKEKQTLAELKTLGLQLLSSRVHANNLPRLLPFVSPSSPPSHALEAIVSLQSFFVPLLPHLLSSSHKPPSNDDPETIFYAWVDSKLEEFSKSLIDICTAPHYAESLRVIALDRIMDLVKLKNGKKFDTSFYRNFLRSIVNSSVGVDFLLESLASKYFNFIDVRYFTYINLKELSDNLKAKHISGIETGGSDGSDCQGQLSASVELSIRKIHYLLAHIPSLELLGDKSCLEMWFGSGSDLEEPLQHDIEGEQKINSDVPSSVRMAKKMKLKFTKAWESFLQLPLPLDVYKEVLVSLHQLVIPHFSEPIKLCDFLTRSYDVGGVVSVMALSSLYILMTQHGLEYPNFYEKLYALLVPSTFIAKHRAKFLELLDSCLKSPLLPAYLAAAFAKKLSRLTLSVPPSGELVIIALIHNLLRRHPSIHFLAHREIGDVTADGDKDNSNTTNVFGGNLGIDLFKDEESDPKKSYAMRSSLWEIDTLQHHYYHRVSRSASSIKNVLRARSKTSEQAISYFSSGSYGTIFGKEINREIEDSNKVAFAFYRETPTLFSEDDFAGWAFKDEDGKEQNARDSIVSEEHGHDSAKRQRIECS